MMGNMLRERDTQYIAVRDEASRTWRILDSWHETLSAYSVEDEVPDDSPAIKILTEGEFIVLVREAARIGILENANLGNDEPNMDFDIISEEHESTVSEMEKELVQYRTEIAQLKAANQELNVKVQRSEGFELKEMAMQTLLKLTSMSDLERLTKE